MNVQMNKHSDKECIPLLSRKGWFSDSHFLLGQGNPPMTAKQCKPEMLPFEVKTNGQRNLQGDTHLQGIHT